MGLLSVVSVALNYPLYLIIPWVLSFLIYRFAFHPLRKYPGPFLARLTDAYGGFYALGKRPHVHMYQNIRKYGPVYREAPNRLVFSSLAAIDDIYYNDNVTKGRAYRQARWLDTSIMFDTPDKAEHRRKRQVIGRALSDRTLRAFEPAVSAQIDIFLHQLLQASQRAEVTNMTLACKRLAVDIVAEMAFGCALNTQTETTNRFLPEAMSSAIFMTNVYYTWPTFGFLAPVLRLVARKRVLTFSNTVRNMLRARMAEPKDAKADFYSIVASAHERGEEGLHEGELPYEALFFMSAGGTTVSSAMCGTFFYLAHHPDVYARLATEIRSTFSSGRDIHGGSKLASCKYLRAVIDESLRIAPPSLTPLWREFEPTAKGVWVVDGHVIPRGTQVTTHTWSVLHDPEYFPEPFAFRPERWLAPEKGEPDSREREERLATMKRAQVSFGMGERNCAGKSMAYLETSLAIARTLWYFDFEIAPGEAGKLGAGSEPKGGKHPWAAEDQFQLQDILVADHDGPNLLLKARAEFWRELESE